MSESTDNPVASGDDVPWPTMFPRDEYDGARPCDDDPKDKHDPEDKEDPEDQDAEPEADSDQRMQRQLEIANDTPAE